MKTMTLDDAIALATSLHEGQVDKAGKPYIEHPIRVMRLVQDRTDSEHIAMAAVLHDVLEDTDFLPLELEEKGCPDPVIDALVALTHFPRESYEEYVARAAENSIAKVVKRADIMDNMDTRRLALLPIEEQDRLLGKYAKACRILDE